MLVHMPSPSEDSEVQHIRVIFDATDGVLYIRKHQEEEKKQKKRMQRFDRMNMVAT